MSNESSQYVDISSTSEYAEFTEVRRKRTEGPALPRDRILQISNIVLQQWYNDYVTNMRNARKLKDSRQQFRRAKANAELILLGTGQSSFILSGYMFAEPLLDSAKNLFGHLTGAIGAKNGIKTKRKRHGTASETDSSDSEKRRTKLRADEETEIARGGIENEEGYVAMADDIDPSIEIAREAMTMMEDYSTQLPLPWSGSRAGSVHSARLSRQASVLSSRAIGIGIGTGMRPGSVHSFDRRTSRIPSASPMLSRSIMRRSSGHNHESQSGLDDAGFLPDFESGPDTSPQYHGRSTQDITESQQLHDTFIKESTEFMIWIQNSIDAKKDEDSEETVEQHISVKFEELLPIQQYARAVAAQAFLHVLVLANRNAIKVAQKTADEAGSDLWWATLDISISGI